MVVCLISRYLWNETVIKLIQLSLLYGFFNEEHTTYICSEEKNSSFLEMTFQKKIEWMWSLVEKTEYCIQKATTYFNVEIFTSSLVIDSDVYVMSSTIYVVTMDPYKPRTNSFIKGSFICNLGSKQIDKTTLRRFLNNLNILKIITSFNYNFKKVFVCKAFNSSPSRQTPCQSYKQRHYRTTPLDVL